MSFDVLLRFAGKKINLVGLDEEDHISKMIRKSRAFYEIELLTEIFHRAMPDWFFIDAGAHIGNHSTFFGGILGLQGYAIEQDSTSYASLCGNLAANGLTERVRAINSAVGQNFGRAKGIGETSLHNSGTRMIELDQDGDVQVIPLDSLEVPRLDLLKLDVEGFEVASIKGGTDTIMHHKPLIIAEAINRQKFDELVTCLGPMGYRPTRRYNVTPTYLFEAD